MFKLMEKIEIMFFSFTVLERQFYFPDLISKKFYKIQKWRDDI